MSYDEGEPRSVPSSTSHKCSICFDWVVAQSFSLPHEGMISVDFSSKDIEFDEQRAPVPPLVHSFRQRSLLLVLTLLAGTQTTLPSVLGARLSLSF